MQIETKQTGTLPPPKKEAWWQMEIGGGMSQKDIILMTRRMSTMIGHGFSVIDALRSIELQAQTNGLKKVIQHIKNKVEMGNSFSQALKDFPKYFSNVYVSIVAIGEESGKLSEVLNYLEKQESQIYELKRKALSAMVYPAVIMGLMIVIAIGMILFLIPFLKDIFSSFEAELPITTRILLQSETLIKTWWWAILGGGAFLYFTTRYLTSRPAIKSVMHKTILKLPLFGSLAKAYNVAQIIRTFATLNKSGVPISQSLEILPSVPKNTEYKQALEAIGWDVKKGVIFSESLAKHEKLFPPLVIESIRLGEKTGNLTESSNDLAELYEEDVKNTLETLTTLIQPLMLVFVGIMVAVFALSIIMPLQRLPQLIQQVK